MEKKIDITSTAIEKSIDLLKGFLDKLISPAVEETGLLIKDKAATWRFNNQLKALAKAKEKCEKHNISTKVISFKLLFPLLEYAGLEDDEFMQDKWANLLTNMVDSEQNIENHVFPYILSQISITELELLEKVFNDKIKRQNKLKRKLEDYLLNKDLEISKLEKEIENIEIDRDNEYHFDSWRPFAKINSIENEIRKIKDEEWIIKGQISKNEVIKYPLEEYEFANIIRLGLVKVIPRPYAHVDSHRIENNPHSDYLEIMDLPIDIVIEEEDLIMTELGELFVQACNDKKTFIQ